MSRFTVLWFAASLAHPATATPTAGSASGYALTFDGRGTDVATADLPAELFSGASGLTFTSWVRTFGYVGAPYNPCVLTMLAPGFANWFQPMWWHAASSFFEPYVFDSPQRASDDVDHLEFDMDKFQQWRHYALAWQGAGGILQIFLDGELLVNRTGVKPDYNLTKYTASGVYMALGINALSRTSHNPMSSFRGSLDNLQLWTHRLTAYEIKEDFESGGKSSALPYPALKYTFDEGSGEFAYNTGFFKGSGPTLHLGHNPDGSSYFADSGSSTVEYTVSAGKNE